jgi:hypothetical protein
LDPQQTPTGSAFQPELRNSTASTLVDGPGRYPQMPQISADVFMVSTYLLNLTIRRLVVWIEGPRGGRAQGYHGDTARKAAT